MTFDHSRLALKITKTYLALTFSRDYFGQQKSVTKNYQNIVLSFLAILLRSFGKSLRQEGAKYGPRATSSPRRVIFQFERSLFDCNVARETQIMTKCGPRTKIVAHPWPKRFFKFFILFQLKFPDLGMGWPFIDFPTHRTNSSTDRTL